MRRHQRGVPSPQLARSRSGPEITDGARGSRRCGPIQFDVRRVVGSCAARSAVRVDRVRLARRRRRPGHGHLRPRLRLARVRAAAGDRATTRRVAGPWRRLPSTTFSPSSVGTTRSERPSTTTGGSVAAATRSTTRRRASGSRTPPRSKLSSCVSAPLGDVLELAAGTGTWTPLLLRHAARVTAIDAAPEALAITRGKTGGRANYIVADVFGWEPPHQCDECVFGFWLSHVPSSRTSRSSGRCSTGRSNRRAASFSTSIAPWAIRGMRASSAPGARWNVA